jgi:hypothetical protein
MSIRPYLILVEPQHLFSDGCDLLVGVIQDGLTRLYQTSVSGYRVRFPRHPCQLDA